MTTPLRPASRMAAEMAEQPAVIERILSQRRALVTGFREVVPASFCGLALVGRGSSEHAAGFGRHLLEMVSGLPVVLVPPGVLTVRPGRYPYTGFLAVGISQSGETPDVATTLTALRRAGATTVGLTAHPVSRLGDSAQLAIDLVAGTEEAVPASKTFTASLVMLLLLAEALGPVEWAPDDLDRLPGTLVGILADTSPAADTAARLSGHDGWACVGAGVFSAIAAEAALKLEEVALVVADHHSSASFRHGPIATAGPRRPILAITGRAADGTLELADDLRRRGSPVVVAAPLPSAQLSLAELPDPLVAVAAAVRAQQLALALAERRGIDPDRPPGLEKVTRT